MYGVHRRHIGIQFYPSFLAASADNLSAEGRSALPCKDKRPYPLTLRVSRYGLLALQISADSQSMYKVGWKQTPVEGGQLPYLEQLHSGFMEQIYLVLLFISSLHTSVKCWLNAWCAGAALCQCWAHRSMMALSGCKLWRLGLARKRGGEMPVTCALHAIQTKVFTTPK